MPYLGCLLRISQVESTANPASEAVFIRRLYQKNGRYHRSTATLQTALATQCLSLRIAPRSLRIYSVVLLKSWCVFDSHAAHSRGYTGGRCACSKSVPSIHWLVNRGSWTAQTAQWRDSLFCHRRQKKKKKQGHRHQIDFQNQDLENILHVVWTVLLQDPPSTLSVLPRSPHIHYTRRIKYTV